MRRLKQKQKPILRLIPNGEPYGRRFTAVESDDDDDQFTIRSTAEQLENMRTGKYFDFGAQIANRLGYKLYHYANNNRWDFRRENFICDDM